MKADCKWKQIEEKLNSNCYIWDEEWNYCLIDERKELMSDVKLFLNDKTIFYRQLGYLEHLIRKKKQIVVKIWV